jgi:alpha-galactosidase
MGAHIGPPRAHTTGRVHTLAFRAATALFGHLGVEQDVLALDDRARAELAEAIALHRRFRGLLHAGDTVRFDAPAPYLAHGVYSPDRTEGLVSVALLASAPSLTPPPVRLRGLDPERRYRVEHVRLPGERWGIAKRHPSWLATGLTISGRSLDIHGIRPPVLLPESAVLVHLTSTE